MDTYTQVPRRVFIDLVESFSPMCSMDPRNDADVARSQTNIQQWLEYLPEDCIKSTIRMGWDVTT
jgi:hypothetical protein